MDYHFDIAIIGLGCAGSHVALELLRRQPDIRLAVIDNAPQQIHKKWSYWEHGKGKWDDLIIKKWDQGLFKSTQGTIELDLKPYSYKTLDSDSFTAFAKAKLQQHPNCLFINATVNSILESDDRAQKILHTDGVTIANLVLDSRIDEVFFEDNQAITLQQHFKGWTIETQSDCFNPDRFTMMDYSLRHSDTTSFTYVLPYNSRKALVEFTYFSPSLVDDSTYDEFLKKYVSEHLNITDYKIVEIEKGIIPMTTYDFAIHHSEKVIKIGTAGGWVKPSTGYSFKMCEKKAAILVNNYLNELALTTDLFSRRFKVYDASMLNVLHDYNDDGPAFFHRLYAKNSTSKLLKFLDEETNFLEEIWMMQSMTSVRMVKSFFRNLFS